SGGKRWRPHCLRYDSVAPGGLGSLYPCAVFEFGASASAVVRKYPGRRLRGNQTRVDVDADRPELWLGVAPGFLAPARSVGGPISHGSWWNTSNSTPIIRVL